MTYQLVLRKEYTLSDLKNKLKNYAKDNREPFVINLDSINLSSKLAFSFTFRKDCYIIFQRYHDDECSQLVAKF